MPDHDAPSPAPSPWLSPGQLGGFAGLFSELLTLQQDNRRGEAEQQRAAQTAAFQSAGENADLTTAMASLEVDRQLAKAMTGMVSAGASLASMGAAPASGSADNALGALQGFSAASAAGSSLFGHYAG